MDHLSGRHPSVQQIGAYFGRFTTSDETKAEPGNAAGDWTSW